MATQTGAHYLLQGLVELGMEYLFANLGTDHVSIVEELARWRQEGRSDLQVILCPHENVAVHMAAGYAAMTGRGQPVLVHVDIGTANSGNALHNLFRSRLPVFLMAGRSPYSLRGELPASRELLPRQHIARVAVLRRFRARTWTSGSRRRSAARRGRAVAAAVREGESAHLLDPGGRG